MLRIGKAQSLFREKYPKVQFQAEMTAALSKNEGKIWPLLEKLLGEGSLDYIDFALAQHFAKGLQEGVATLLCCLSKAARQGHLCVSITSSKVIPRIEDIFDSEERHQSISQDDIAALEMLIIAGAIDGDFSSIPVKKNGDRYYLEKYWHLETQFLQHLASLTSGKAPRFAVDADISNINLLPEQKAAVLQACQETFTLITGGPGTGKTYTAGVLLRTIWEGLSAEQKGECKISLAAPTGKAAANLDRSIRNQGNLPIPKAQTLHQLLQINNRRSGMGYVLPSDIIIVDECSMIDVYLMERLFTSIKPGARLIMMGDKDQLPSVEAGSLFADLTEYLAGETCLVELKTCLRAESLEIIELAASIKSGVLNLPSSTAIFRITPEGVEENEVQWSLLKHIVPFYPLIKEVPDDLFQLLKAFSSFQLLSPMRKGVLGVETLNAAIHRALRSKVLPETCEVIPIIVTHNDYRLELFNGEIGVLVLGREGGYAIFNSREGDGKVRKIPALMLPSFEHAYCLSVHKSQGSEFNHVLLVLPEGSESFGRAALYTGVTRAKKKLGIWGAEATINKMLSRSTRRHSGVLERTAVI